MSTELLPHAHRKLYDLPQHDVNDGDVLPEKDKASNSTVNDLLKYVRSNVMGANKPFKSAFGIRAAVYCDYTASGRSLQFIEDFIATRVLPEYGNTHTTSTVTSLQTTLFRHEARDIVRNSVNASEHDAVIFTGSGCTGAVHKLINALNLAQPPVVFVGPYEHHSNLLPWKELGAHVITIEETREGLVNMRHLEHELKIWQSSERQLIGAFTAASNVTGTLVNVNNVTACLHRHGALAFWDYATAAPYVEIDMNPVITGEDRPLVFKDAVYFSVHKFVGGVQTPGVLIAKKRLFQNVVPHGGGGGSVFFVRRDAHRYLQETEMREEGGTPAIVESIRAGLVMQLKQAIGTPLIQSRDTKLCTKALEAWKEVPGLVLLGSSQSERLPIFSFLVKHPESGLFLHHNYVTAVLNDLFGVQSRGGCACAGPYAQELLGISPELAVQIEDVLAEDTRLDRVHLRRYNEYSDHEILRPGFTRLNLPYFEDDETLNFVFEAVKLVAIHGWKLLPQYNFNPETGEWRHRKEQVFKGRKWLGNISYASGMMEYKNPPTALEEPLTLKACLEEGLKILTSRTQGKLHIGDQAAMFDDVTAKLRWFLLPSEAYNFMQGKTSSKPPHQSPFSPTVYPKDIDENTEKLWTHCTCDQNSCIVHKKTTLQNPKGPETGSSTKVEPLFDEETSQKATAKAGKSERADFQAGLESYLSNGFVNKEEIESELPSENEDIPPAGNANKSSAKELDVISGEKSDFSQSKDISGSNKPNQIATSSSKACDSGVCPCVPRTSKSYDVTTASELLPMTSQTVSQQKKRDWHIPPKATIFRPMADAIKKYNMLENGDRVLVCLSGGKDSLSLLHALHQYQYYSEKKGLHFDLGAVTIDPQTESFDPSPLKQYLKTLGVPYFYEEQCIMEMAKNLPYECASICSYCSRMKRGRIYTAARREGYNVLAMGQHLDDLAESFLMSMFHNGLMRTMKAAYTVDKGDLRVIRPFVTVREKDLRAFAEEKQLPVIAENCPACFEVPKERNRMKQLLASQEVLHPRLFHSISAAMQPLIAINETGVNMNNLLVNIKKPKKMNFTKGESKKVNWNNGTEVTGENVTQKSESEAALSGIEALVNGNET